jgi:prophage regulatory protein
VQDIISKKMVIKMTSLGDRTIDRMEGKGLFPRRRQLTPGRVGWLTREIEEWIQQRGEGKMPVVPAATKQKPR